MKKIIIVITITISLIVLLSYKQPQKNTNTKSSETMNINNIIEDIKNKSNNEIITSEFLKWISKEYGKSILEAILKEKEYNDKIWHKITGNSLTVLNDLYNDEYSKIDNVKIISESKENTISFVGDVSLADNWYIMPKYDERKKKVYGILSEEVVDIMTKTDIMVANNEFTISDRGEKMPGKYYTFRGSPKRLPIYEEMGVDLVTLANNHVYDFGKDAFNDMLNSLKEYKIPYIGAGKNIEEAKKPYYFILNGYKIAFINATRAEKNIMTPEATEEEGGVFRCYNPEALINKIKETKPKSDYVITLIHWGKEDSHDLENVQIETSKKYIEAGTDIIVGSHAHVLQGIEFYQNKPIIYNLGDFIFNDETKDTGIFQIKLNDEGEMNYSFIPALESNEYTKIVIEQEKRRIINNMNKWSINALIDEEGNIYEKNA